MKSFMNKVKGQLQKDKDGEATEKDSMTDTQTLNAVTQQDVYQYRYHFGTNLGSIFVLEKWLFGSMFDGSCSGSSEYDAVVASLKERGLDGTRQKWESHWRSALSDQDIEFLRDTASCTTVRLPLGYFTLGPRYCPSGTPFHGDPAEVYVGAWQAVLDTCSRLANAGIGVLLDLHAVPGGANNNDHSGTTTGKAAHWEHRSLRDLSTACLQFMAGEIAQGKIPNATGLQFCNEACHGAKHMYDWYAETVQAVHSIAPTLPLYVSDAWDLGSAVKWAASINSTSNLGRTSPVVVDVHKYYTFSESDRNQSPQQIIARIPGALKPAEELAGSVHDRGAAQCFVGEWSAVLDGRTWGKVGDHERDGLEKQFVQTQSQRWEQASGGHAFWTAKMQWMDGGGWGFFEQIKRGNLVAPAYMTCPFDDVQARVTQASELKARMKDDTVAGHVGYWDRTSPGKTFEHWRFERGFDQGFDDVLAFAGMRRRWQGRMGKAGMDRIGMREIWVWRRMADSGGRSKFMWEWEQGFRQGMRAAENALGM